MWKIIMAALLLAVALLAAPPVPSKVLTVKVTTNKYKTGSIVVGEAAPSDSRLFSDEKEVLASIKTEYIVGKLCQLEMSTILTRPE